MKPSTLRVSLSLFVATAFLLFMSCVDLDFAEETCAKNQYGSWSSPAGTCSQDGEYDDSFIVNCPGNGCQQTCGPDTTCQTF